MLKIKILIAGDTSDWNINDFAYKNIDPDIRKAISDSDLFIFNMEGPIRLRSEYEKCELFNSRFINNIFYVFLTLTRRKQPVVFSTKKMLPLLTTNANTCVTLATNHIKDLGKRGFLDTIEILKKNQIGYVGAGLNKFIANEPRRLNIRGKEIYILNYNYIGLRKYGFYANIYGATKHHFGAAYLNPQKINVEINKIKSISPDAFIILVLHAGKALAENVKTTKINLSKFENLGAHCTIFHHSHKYFNIPSNKIFFLGDFLFYEPGALPEEREGGYLELNLNPRNNHFDPKINVYTFRNGYPFMQK